MTENESAEIWRQAIDELRQAYKDHDQDIKPFWFYRKVLEMFERKALEALKRQL